MLRVRLYVDETAHDLVSIVKGTWFGEYLVYFWLCRQRNFAHNCPFFI